MSNTVSLPGFELSYVRQGEGEPVILVHGSVVDGRVWAEHQAALSTGFDVIVPTQRYFGPKPWTDSGDRFCIDDHGADLTAFIKQIGVEKLDVVGWSYGGAVTLAAAVMNPEVFRRIVLYEPAFASHIGDADAQSEAAADRSRMMASSQGFVAQGDHVSAVEAFIDGVNDRSGTFRGLSEEIQTSMRSSARTLELLYKASPPGVRREDLSRLRCPVEVGVGTESRDFFKLASVNVASAIPSAKLRWIESGRHMWPVEEPESCIEFIQRSLGPQRT